MTRLPNTAQSPTQIVSLGIAIGISSFSKLFMLSTFIGCLWLIPYSVIAFHVGNSPTSLLKMLEYRSWALVAAEFTNGCGALFLLAIMLMRVANLDLNGTSDFHGEWRRALKLLGVLLVSWIISTIGIRIGLVLLIIPGVLLAVSLSFFPFCIVLDKLGPIAALNRSHTLVWGNWWRTFSVMLLLGLLFMVGFIVLMPIVYLLGMHTDMMTGRDILVSGVLIAILVALSCPFWISVMYVQYNDLKLQREQSQPA